MKLAIIKSGVVENVVVATAAPEFEALGYVVVPADGAGPGWTYNGTAFSPPVELPVELPAEWFISRGAFFDRFGAQKIPILASTDPIVQAIVTDCMVRQYLDLKGRAADIGGAIDILIGKGFAVSKTAILNTKPTAEERYKP